jgi:hypothetical protein
LEKAAKKMHLHINQGKMQCMPVTKKICTVGTPYLEIGFYTHETVYSFTYWRSTTKMILLLTSNNQQRNISMGLENIKSRT